MKKTILIAVFILVSIFTFGQTEINSLDYTCYVKDWMYLTYEVRTGDIDIIKTTSTEIPIKHKFNYDSHTKILFLTIYSLDDEGKPCSPKKFSFKEINAYEAVDEDGTLTYTFFIIVNNKNYGKKIVPVIRIECGEKTEASDENNVKMLYTFNAK